ncbi:uncharacterized protein LOC116849338 [Odontomachus brunneus]|uniref:uncharacterized protein LOC116849338 n=1 Tax=Odontomachus brunneus TaxID=486640 RepID=UPI0013F29A6C|nr:uncharacterized protein LOC116849338 [Odontomachus brunneus]
MLLSTTYTLNNSYTKRVQVGLQANDAGRYEATIKLIGNLTDYIYLELEAWQKFQEEFDFVHAYLRGVDKITPQPLILKNASIYFTTTYGSRAIMVTRNREAGEEKATTADSATATEPPKKKRKTYSPSIAMQKITFEGLQSIASCIDARRKQLYSLTNLVNNCVEFLIAEIELHLPNRYLDEDMVKNTLWNNFEEIEKNVQRQLLNFDFLDVYFDILFLELTSFHLHQIVRRIIKNQAMQLASNS